LPAVVPVVLSRRPRVVCATPWSVPCMRAARFPSLEGYPVAGMVWAPGLASFPPSVVPRRRPSAAVLPSACCSFWVSRFCGFLLRLFLFCFSSLCCPAFVAFVCFCVLRFVVPCLWVFGFLLSPLAGCRRCCCPLSCPVLANLDRIRYKGDVGYVPTSPIVGPGPLSYASARPPN
jgi:hypothetical protein